LSHTSERRRDGRIGLGRSPSSGRPKAGPVGRDDKYT